MTTPAEIQIQNTLSGKKERFVPKVAGEVSLYGCGPTVYGLAHVGNARTAITCDLVVRVFKLAGYRTRYARNITDIDDRIIKVANDHSRDWTSVVTEFTDAYHHDLAALKALLPDYEPTATTSIGQIIEMIQGLVAKDTAYVSETPFGTDVYFAVSKFTQYGKLSKRKLEDMLAGTRIEIGETKRDTADFALWKAAKPGEPSWPSPWGEGRPGWHIECSAMIHKIFPTGLDVHLGGNDLIFPHHENEIAQSEAFSEHSLATYWIHGGMLNLGREKMSKSVGNILSIQKFNETYGPQVLRLLFAQHHYRGPMDFSEESIQRGEALLERIYTAKQHMLQAKSAPSSGAELPPELTGLPTMIRESLFDDFNTAKALGFVLKALRTCYREHKNEYWAAMAESFELFERALGLFDSEPQQELATIKARRLKRLGVTSERCQSIEQRLEHRELARKNKDFAESDRLRKELENEGVVVMDGADGAAWTLKSAPS